MKPKRTRCLSRKVVYSSETRKAYKRVHYPLNQEKKEK